MVTSKVKGFYLFLASLGCKTGSFLGINWSAPDRTSTTERCELGRGWPRLACAKILGPSHSVERTERMVVWWGPRISWSVHWPVSLTQWAPKLPPLKEKFDLRPYPRWLRPGITLHPGAYYGVPNCSSRGCTPFPSVCPPGLLGVRA